MPRKTTKDSLDKFSCNNPKIDALARALLLKVANNDIKMIPQSEWEDEEYSYNEYYGAHKDVGITIQKRKKLRGINPHYYLIIEIDSEPEPITLGGRFGGKAWGLAQVQNNNPTNVLKVSDVTISTLFESLGMTDSGND
jgi:hypothetical protein